MMVRCSAVLTWRLKGQCWLRCVLAEPADITKRTEWCPTRRSSQPAHRRQYGPRPCRNRRRRRASRDARQRGSRRRPRHFQDVRVSGGAGRTPDEQQRVGVDGHVGRPSGREPKSNVVTLRRRRRRRSKDVGNSLHVRHQRRRTIRLRCLSIGHHAVDSRDVLCSAGDTRYQLTTTRGEGAI